jgi:hypothetical protein
VRADVMVLARTESRGLLSLALENLQE